MIARPTARWRARRAAEQRDAELPEALERIASALRGGRSLGPVIVEVAATTPAPLGDELAAAVHAADHGASVPAAIGAWADAGPGSSDRDLALTALELGARTGGEVSRACDRVAATLRERREVRGEARALATQARASAAVLTAAPLGFAALISMIEPGVVGFLLATPPGLACLAVGLTLDGLGAAWMARIVEAAS